MTIRILTTLTIFTFILDSYCVRVPPNPCPEYFQYYRTRDGSQLYGEVTIPYDGAEYLNMNLNGSFAALLPHRKFTIKLITTLKELLAVTDRVVYEVYFPSQTVLPRITRIEYNGREFCRGPQEPLIPGEEGITNLWSAFTYRFTRPFNYVPPELDGFDSSMIPVKGQTTPSMSVYPTPTKPPPTYPTRPSQTYPTRPSPTPPPPTRPPPTRPPPTRPQTPPVVTPTRPTPPKTPGVYQCGVTNNIEWGTNSVGVESTDKQYPWLAAMMVYDEALGTFAYKCSANLISARHVLTAGRCVQYLQVQVVPTENIMIVMGTKDLTNWAKNGTVSRRATKVKVHPDFKKNFQSANADIAIITLDSPIRSSDKIQPVCVWNDDEEVNLAPFVNQLATLVGWNREVTEIDTPQPMSAKIPIVPQLDCMTQDGLSGNALSDKTFCAGDKSGKVSCVGDSGSGLVLSKNGIYYLRGIESFSVMKNNQCDSSSYSIFCDVAKYMDWVRNSIFESVIILKHLD